MIESYHKHLCCSTCRRFLQSSTTYLHERLDYLFCDKDVTTEKQFRYEICNCIIYSTKCFKGHRKFCNGKRYICDSCQKFLTSSRGQSSLQIKTSPICSGKLQYKFCYEKITDEYFCKLKHVKYSSLHTRLGFFRIHSLLKDPYFLY